MQPGAQGDATGINITTGSLEVKNGAQIDSSTFGKGNAGSVDIHATDTVVFDGGDSEISAGTASSVQPGAEGNAGGVTITTESLEVKNGASIFASTFGQGDAGNININTQLTINENAQISAFTQSSGQGGNIIITAPETLKIAGNGQITVRSSGEGNAGQIDIISPNITLSDGIDITAFTESTGNAGNINLEGNKINIQPNTQILAFTETEGNGGNITVKATETINLGAESQLSVETNSAGKAGNIEIATPQLTIGENAQISATVNIGATSTEDGGNITINTNKLDITGKLGIFAETEADANAGTVALSPYKNNPDIEIKFSNDGFISASTSSAGNGGNIDIKAPENIEISGEGFISVETEGSGSAGTINIETKNLTIAEKTTISASTSDSGKGGTININPTETFQLEGQILTETTDTGDGGIININTGEMTAPNSTISAKSTDAGNAGEINIEAENNITTGIITSEASSNTQSADGGNISITSEQGEINATQAIQSFSNRGNAGNVTLQAENNITTNTISSHGQQKGGEITITSETGNIDTSNGDFLANYSGGGNAGDVTLTAPQGNIITNNLYSFADADGGKITLQAGGDINLKENSNIISASEPPTNNNTDKPGKGGDIILEAGNNINTTNTQIYSGANIGDTGKIDIIAEGAIETGQINLASGFIRDRVTVNENFTLIPIPGEEATEGVAGNITLRSNNSTIDTTAGTINSRSPDGTGNITINARGNITTGKLEASALNESNPTTGGNVEIISQQGEINATQEIETLSKQGTAGNVNLTAAGHIHTDTILSHGTQKGGNITINSRSENSIDAAGELNTFSTEGIAGNVTVTSPGSIDISGIRSEGMQQGGDIRVESEIGEINSTGDIDSFSNQGRGGNVEINAPESVTLADVSSYGMTESGDLRIQSRTATVETGNVTTQAPAGSSGSIVINGTEVGTGDLSSIGTTSAGEINVAATDGSIQTFDITISSDGTVGNLTLRATEDITTEDINQNAGEGDVNSEINSGGDQTTGDINQTAGGDTNNTQTAGGDITTGDINQTAGGDTNNTQTAGGDITTGDINQTAGGDATNTQTAGGDITTGDINQTAGGDATNIQTAGGDITTGDINQTAGGDATNIQTAGGDLTTGDINQTAGGDATNI
ncbi:MAG: filamentous hemagglutinin, partial [Trichodesmium sp. MO_231.B1]|nr:filamentous hemagglutinin [Trichodesmium sp. MO_231.B1]